MFNYQARPTIFWSSSGLCFPATSPGAVTPALHQGRWLLAETLDSGTLGCNHSCHHYEGQQKNHTALSLNSASLRLGLRVKIILHFLSIFQKQPDQRCPRKQKSSLKSHHLYCIAARLLYIFKQNVSSESPKKKSYLQLFLSIQGGLVPGPLPMGSGSTVVSIENKSIYKWTHTVQTQRVQGSTEPLWNYTLTYKGIADWELLDEKYKIGKLMRELLAITRYKMQLRRSGQEQWNQTKKRRILLGIFCFLLKSFKITLFLLLHRVQSLRCVWLFLWPSGVQHTRLPCPSPSSRVCSNSCPLSQWCHPAISSSVAPFSSCHQAFPASGSFSMSGLFASGGQSISASASASVLPMNIQGWFPLGLTVLISLQSKGLLRVFSSTTTWKHQFFSAQPSLWFNSHIRTWLLENHSFDDMDLCQQSDVSAF